MKATYVKPVGETASGARIVDVIIVADEAPDNLPTTGAGIEGLDDTDVFAPLSVLCVVESGGSKLFVANASGVFKPQ